MSDNVVSTPDSLTFSGDSHNWVIMKHVFLTVLVWERKKIMCINHKNNLNKDAESGIAE